MALLHANRAKALIGTPFVPQGRDPLRGLDCVGLALSAYALPPAMARSDYRLRGNYRQEIEGLLRILFRRVSRRAMRPGDLMLLAPAKDQLHLAVATSAGFVHADAGLRRVVETPGSPAWPLIGIYRRRVRNPER